MLHFDPGIDSFMMAGRHREEIDRNGARIEPSSDSAVDRNRPEIDRNRLWSSKSGPMNLQRQQQLQVDDDRHRQKKIKKQSKTKMLLSIFTGHYKNFECAFSVHIHSIRNLPSSMEGALMEVHCVRKSRSTKTLQSRCYHGSVHFEETLQLQSKIRASREYPHTIKHPASKTFRLLMVMVPDNHGRTILGEVTLDLGRTLPTAIAEAPDAASWTSAFRVCPWENGVGPMDGSTVVASIGYDFLDGNTGDRRRSGTMSKSCREQSPQSSSSWFWKRSIRPLSGLISTSSSSAFGRSESMRSMPDLWGLAHDVYCSASEDHVGQPEVGTGPGRKMTESCCKELEDDDRMELDSVLCSLVRAQMETSRKMVPKQLQQESIDVSLDDQTGSEDGTEVKDDGLCDEEVMDRIEQEKLALFLDEPGSRTRVSEVDEEAESVAQQFLRMLKDDEPVENRRLEPLGSPVYEASWVLAPIPEEEAEEESEVEDQCCKRMDIPIPIAAPLPQLQDAASSSSSCSSCSVFPFPANVEPEVNSAELQGFVPVWRKQVEDVELDCIMEAASRRVRSETTGELLRCLGLKEDHHEQQRLLPSLSPSPQPLLSIVPWSYSIRASHHHS